MTFLFVTGLRRQVFSNVRLTGSWDDAGRFVDDRTRWSVVPMEPIVWEDGCRAYRAEVPLAPADDRRVFCWSVLVDGAHMRDAPAVVTEADDAPGSDGPRLERCFVPAQSAGTEIYHLSMARRLGAQKVSLPGRQEPALRFAVWAPNAEAIDVVLAARTSGYIADYGTGIDPDAPVIALARGEGGVWQSDDGDARLARFADWVGAAYMFRVRKEGGAIAYRTDLYSRAQAGTGAANPHGAAWTGGREALDGTVSCSVVVDPDATFDVGDDEFWRDELRHDRPLPQRTEDLIIYELHIGSLGFGRDGPGNLGDAAALLDYLEDLGVNAVELLPVSEFEGNAGWGYGTSHFFAIESSLGGRDQLKHFVRECHRRGIAVLLDVVFNHFVHDAERAQWHYDSDREEHNVYYWYEGARDDYAEASGGYLDNMSSGFAPRFSEEMVRRMFTSSAVAMIDELHVDGFRVDQTTSMHACNALHADGRPVGRANVAGARFLRELSRTVKLVRRATFLIAEDHSNWARVKEPPEFVGLGFDAAWYADYHHHLVGNRDNDEGYAKLLRVAGLGTDVSLRMDYFGAALGATGRGTVVYHESHDEAGNSPGSARTLSVALNLPEGRVPDQDARRIGEDRCRFAAAVTLFSAGTPLFLFGEEIGAVKPFRYDDFVEHREDLWGDRKGSGSRLFEFYRDAIRLRLRYGGLRSRDVEVVHTDNDGRVVAFRRSHLPEEFLVVGSLANQAHQAYVLDLAQLRDGDAWHEVFTSDAPRYGGAGIGNPAPIIVTGGTLTVRLPARGVVVLRRRAG